MAKYQATVYENPDGSRYAVLKFDEPVYFKAGAHVEVETKPEVKTGGCHICGEDH